MGVAILVAGVGITLFLVAMSFVFILAFMSLFSALYDDLDIFACRVDAEPDRMVSRHNLMGGLQDPGLDSQFSVMSMTVCQLCGILIGVGQAGDDEILCSSSNAVPIENMLAVMAPWLWDVSMCGAKDA